MNDEVLVKVEGVSKKFCRNLRRSLWYGVKDIAFELVGSNKNDQLLNLPVTLSLTVGRRRVWCLRGPVFNLPDSSFRCSSLRMTFLIFFSQINWQL
jgi:hypothetical protein